MPPKADWVMRKKASGAVNNVLMAPPFYAASLWLGRSHFIEVSAMVDVILNRKVK